MFVVTGFLLDTITILNQDPNELVAYARASYLNLMEQTKDPEVLRSHLEDRLRLFGDFEVVYTDQDGQEVEFPDDMDYVNVTINSRTYAEPAEN